MVNPLKLAIRFDDITPDMDWEKFRYFEKKLDEMGIKPLLGIVPDNQDPNLQVGEMNKNYREQLKTWQEKGYVMALHGYQHLYTTKKGGLFPLNNFSEFAGLPYQVQYEMLEKAKNKLNALGVYTDIFMAPAHSYDRNTLKALQALGFTKITDGFGDGPYQWKGMTFYPISFKLSQSLQDTKGTTTMVIHANTVSDLDYYNRLFDSHKEQFISYDEYLKMPAAKQTSVRAIRELILAKLKYILVKLKS